MGRKVAEISLTPIKDEADWQKMLDDSTSKVVVVDVYQDWCGPCEVLNPVWSAISLEFDDFKNIGSFRSIESGSVEPLSEFTGEESTCRPLFLIFRNRNLVKRVYGCNAPHLKTIIMDTIQTTGLLKEVEETENSS